MQVAWLGKPIAESTWEPESNLPPSLVAEFEAGILREVQKVTFSTGGQSVHTLSTGATQPNVKHPRIQLPEYTAPVTG